MVEENLAFIFQMPRFLSPSTTHFAPSPTQVQPHAKKKTSKQPSISQALHSFVTCTIIVITCTN
jgi:hypothetical protein